jgi:hypothetical protein
VVSGVIVTGLEVIRSFTSIEISLGRLLLATRRPTTGY